MLSVLCYINIKKRPVEQLEGVFFIVRHSLHYQIRPGILRFSVHILIALLVPVYLCTKIPLCEGAISNNGKQIKEGYIGLGELYKI